MALIATFGLTCYQAAKIQDIPYTNAKVIYRAYKLKKDPALRALGNLLDDDTADEPTKELQRSIWLGCLRELTERMTSNFFTERQLSKLYQCNFDLFVNNELRCDLDKMGYKFLANCQIKSNDEGHKLVTLPRPTLLITPTSQQLDDKPETPTSDNQILESDDEKETLHQILFNPSGTGHADEQVYPSNK